MASGGLMLGHTKYSSLATAIASAKVWMGLRLNDAIAAVPKLYTQVSWLYWCYLRISRVRISPHLPLHVLGSICIRVVHRQKRQPIAAQPA
jgi:hypothetical protein